MDYCKCGSVLVDGKCSNERCPSKSKKHKDWVIYGRSMDFKKPVSYEDAAVLARKLNMQDKKT